MVPACHAARILPALDGHVRNHVSAQRFGASPKRAFLDLGAVSLPLKIQN